MVRMVRWLVVIVFQESYNDQNTSPNRPHHPHHHLVTLPKHRAHQLRGGGCFFSCFSWPFKFKKTGPTEN